MTHFNFPLKAAAVIAALSVTIVAAPTAFAGDSAYTKASKRVVSKINTQRQDRGTRTDRSVRDDRGTRNERGTRRNDRGMRNDRGTRTRHTTRTRSNRHLTRDYVNLRSPSRTSYSRHRSNGYLTNYRPASYSNYRRGNGYRHNGYNTNYRSGSGISFSFGSPGYSSYRWAPSNFGFYRPGRVSYASYRNQTRCDRVVVDGLQYGTIRPVSVKQCYNPWDGYYIVQGSEQIAYNSW